MRERLFEPGTVLANGRYRIERLLGEGGMGAVYEATELILQRPVALKVLLPEYSHNTVARARMEREARALARVRCPHVVAVHTVFDQDGLLVMDLEFVAGGTLESQLAAHPNGVPPQVAVGWTMQILEGIEALHEAGLVHRDVKPTNVLIDSKGALKVADLGVAFAADPDTRIRTRHDSVFGTPAYMSPEHVHGAAYVTQLSDLYAVGVILYELVTGNVPFTGTEFEVRLGHVQTPPDLSRIEEIDPHVAAIVAKALAKSADDRFASAAAMRMALAAIAWTAAEPTPAIEAATVIDLPAIPDDTIVEAPAQPPVQAKSSRGSHALTVVTVGAAVAIAALLLAWLAPWRGAPAAPTGHAATRAGAQTAAAPASSQLPRAAPTVAAESKQPEPVASPDVIAGADASVGGRVAATPPPARSVPAAGDGADAGARVVQKETQAQQAGLKSAQRAQLADPAPAPQERSRPEGSAEPAHAPARAEAAVGATAPVAQPDKPRKAAVTDPHAEEVAAWLAKANQTLSPKLRVLYLRKALALRPGDASIQQKLRAAESAQATEQSL